MESTEHLSTLALLQLLLVVEVPLCTEIICCSCSLLNVLQTFCKSCCASYKLMSSHVKEKSAGKLSEKEVKAFLNICSPGCLCSHSNWLWSQVRISHFYFHTLSTSFLFACNYISLRLYFLSLFHQYRFLHSTCLFLWPSYAENTQKHWEMSGFLLSNCYPLLRLSSVTLQMYLCVWRMNLHP